MGETTGNNINVRLIEKINAVEEKYNKNFSDSFFLGLIEVFVVIALDWATQSKAMVLIMVKNYRGRVRYENKNLTWKYTM